MLYHLEGLSPFRLIESGPVPNELISRALHAGAIGAIMKNSPNAQLVATIRSVAAGIRTISPEIERLIEEDPPAKELTPRQLEILNALAKGLSNPEIVTALGICEDRVKDHINAIFTKLNATNRTEAVAIAFRKHLLKI